VGVVGAGTMGTGIAMCFLNAGIPVVLVDNDDASLQRSVASIRSTYEKDVARNRLKQGVLESRLSSLAVERSFSALKKCDLVIEAVFEDMEVKHQVITQIEHEVSDTTVIASNTS